MENVLFLLNIWMKMSCFLCSHSKKKILKILIQCLETVETFNWSNIFPLVKRTSEFLPKSWIVGSSLRLLVWVMGLRLHMQLFCHCFSMVESPPIVYLDYNSLHLEFCGLWWHSITRTLDCIRELDWIRLAQEAKIIQSVLFCYNF